MYLADASKISRTSPVGTWRVLGPGLSTSLFTSLTFANVPLAIISSLPLLAPYELKSLAYTPLPFKNFAAGDVFEMLPAGEI
jgi:hypothetical protein